MRLPLERLVTIEARLSGRVEELDLAGHRHRADLVDLALQRVRRAKERRQLEAAQWAAARRYADLREEALWRGDPACSLEREARDEWLELLGIPTGRKVA